MGFQGQPFLPQKGKAFSTDFQLPPFCNKPITGEREGRYNPTETKGQRNREKPNHPTATLTRRGAEDTRKPMLREGHYSTSSRENATLKQHGLGLGEVIVFNNSKTTTKAIICIHGEL